MKFRRNIGKALIPVLILGAAACTNFVEVTNRSNLEKEAIDPEKDGPMLAQSVYQDFITTWNGSGGDGGGGFPVYGAWFTNEVRAADTFPTRNTVARRDVEGGTTHLNNIWNSLHRNIQFAREVASAIEPAGNSIHLARTMFASGSMIQLMAEHYCVGTIAESTAESGPQMTTVQLLDAAITDLAAARTVAQATGGAAAEAVGMAAQVGIARAHLQAGRKAEAAAAAAGVPADFVYELWHLDDASNRPLGNYIWWFSESRISVVVGPEFRAMADAGDNRIKYVDTGRLAQDGVHRFYRQDKYQGFASPERFASGLEARYIKVEAEGVPADMLAFINERRAVGNQDPIAVTTDMNILMTELMEQKTRDFWLEGKRMADFRRNPEHTRYMIPAGEDTYYKPELGPVRDITCWDTPLSERNNNKKW